MQVSKVCVIRDFPQYPDHSSEVFCPDVDKRARVEALDRLRCEDGSGHAVCRAARGDI